MSAFKQHIGILFLTLVAAVALPRLAPAQTETPVTLQAYLHDAPAPTATIQVDGKDATVWQTTAQDRTLTLKPASGDITAENGTLYLQVTYLDKGYGRLAVHYKGADGKNDKPDKYTRLVLSDTGKWVTAEMRLSGLPAQVPDLQAGLERAKDNTLAMSAASVQAAPFTDAHFQYLLDEAWKRPYDGPSAPNIDNKTLKGKVMVGYQGWFRTPNDPYDQGWIHWGNMDEGHFTTDVWPDITAYPPEALDKAGDVKTLSGKPGYLFSSGWPEVVRTHFAWMRENQIDGAFVQRFLGDMNTSTGRPDWVLGNVRAAANQEGRIWAVEYDVSGAADAKVLDTLKKDWMWMVDNFGVRKDPSYAHENGKLVVFIWGLPFPDRHFTPETANAVVDFFKNDPVYGGNYVIGGIPGNWRKSSPEWQEHFKKYDGVLAWMSKSYAQDVTDFKAMGVDYYPHVNPGFSWANLKHLPTGATEQFTPRDGGRFYEGLFSKAAAAGADRLFVGMFDEYDEGTAIMPMTDDPPPTPKRPGAVVKFFADPKLQEHAEEQNRPQVEQVFDGTAPTKKTPPDNYLMRWEGQIVPSGDGDYTLQIDGAPGDSATLWIDGKQVAKDDNIGSGPAKTASVTLTSGQPVIYRIDYTHRNAPGTMRLMWQAPGGQPEEVPASALVDAWGRFLTNEGHPSDWYLKLTAEAKEMITGQRSPTDLSIK
ncbi:MAG TPA: PA14 domain-containing protein [Candidatus Methylacidiphilales bacterium]|jgi:hypothetical protein|nr:PA14 domain-containing protein [Candidatus Methylacidiphilales bacterium]